MLAYQKSRKFKFFAVAMAVIHLVQIVNPTQLFALTSGPNSPEFSSFEPVATTDMVNLFSGDMTYNLPVIQIPGPDNSGYSLSLSYHSGTSPEEEASWVGYGWTLNPGSINHQVRGISDDSYEESQVKYNKTDPNWSAAVARNNGIELFSIDVAFNESIRFNNTTGLSKSWGFELGFKGMASLGFTRQNGETVLNFNVNPAAIMDAAKKKGEEGKDEEGEKPTKDEKKNLKQMVKDDAKKMKEGKRVQFKNAQLQNNASASLAGASTFTSSYGLYSYNTFSQPMNVTEYVGLSVNRSFSIQGNIPIVNIGLESGTTGNVNFQANKPKTDIKAFGYLYNPNSSSHSSISEPVMSDYTIEKGTTFDNRDYYLGIPYSQPDNFSVTGESIGGSFRLFHSKPGTYYQNKATSHQAIMSSGTEFGIGLHISVGFDFGVGYQRTVMDKWSNQSLNEFQQNTLTDVNHRPIMRFANDMGGKVEYSEATALSTVAIAEDETFPGLKSFNLDEDPLGLNTISSTREFGGSSYINYSTYPASGGVNRTDKIEKSIDIDELSSVVEPAHRIFEISTVNEGGLNYNYGLPVYAFNERNLNIGLENLSSPATILGKYLAYGEAYVEEPESNETVVGDKKDFPYATNYLLTSITTPDYVDVDENGPTENDFGGWTKFAYKPLGYVYPYRTPYTGMLYQQGSISDPDDDMGSINYGEKQVYYLNAIETKTHVACFVTNKSIASDFEDFIEPTVTDYLTGSNEDRLDGLGAPVKTSGADLAASSPTAKNTGAKLRRLEKIVLYAKNRPDVPLKVVHLEYDYSLVKNLPNSVNGAFPNSQTDPVKYNNSGKLVLKRLWFEHEGVVNARIAPYQFKYEYAKKTHFKDPVKTKYDNLFNDVDGYSSSDENPDYNPLDLDAWGNFQSNGTARFNKRMTWLDQKEPDPSFDPAVWQLKQIILPSGGEIHIHYEQKDYMAVQDRDPLAMVPLLNGSVDAAASGADKYSVDNSYFYIDAEELGVDGPLKPYINQLRQYFELEDEEGMPITISEDRRKMIYFKFLYALNGNAPNLDDCRSEFISGYTVVRDIDSNQVQGNWRIRFVLGSDAGDFGSVEDRRNIPRELCYEYAITQRGGKLSNSNCSGEFEDEYTDEIIDEVGDDRDLSFLASGGIFSYKLNVVIPLLADLARKLNYKTPGRADVCLAVNYPRSYLRLPTFKAKKGGGIRVKRLLMYDRGLETGDAMLYGSEYNYLNEDGNSSGVATNEPMSIREENALVTFLPKKTKNFLARLVSGRDTEQNEGPVGENLLPGPSIGHERVVVNNIHNGVSSTGYQISEYYTVKDYPFDKAYSRLGSQYDFDGEAFDNTELTDNKKRDWMKIPALLFSYSLDKRWYTQGYRFILTNMHGKEKSVSTYGGHYHSSDSYLSQQTSYEYYEPGEKVKLLHYNPDLQEFEYYLDTPGKEEEVTMESREINDKTFDLGVEIDVGIGLSWTPPICVSFGLSFGIIENGMSTHVTSKVLRYPSIMRSKTTYQDGVEHVEEYLAFNSENAQPVVTRSVDSYHDLQMEAYTGSTPANDGSYYKWQIPASWIYHTMGKKSTEVNPDNFTNQLSEMAGMISAYGKDADWLAQNFVYDSQSETYKWDVSSTQPAGVLSASAKTYAQNWFSSTAATGVDAVVNDFSLVQADMDELNKKWWMWNEYVFKSSITSANDNSSVVKGGLINDFSMFNYRLVDSLRDGTVTAQSTTGDGIWIRTKTVNKYSPHGKPLEEGALPDELNIVSAVRMGYANLLPVTTGTNTVYENLLFKDFENALAETPQVFHSGERSHDWKLDPYYEFVGANDGIELSQALKDHGAKIFMWLKHDSLLSSHKLNGNLQVRVNNNLRVEMERVSRSGDWQLYTATVNNWGGVPIGSDISVKLYYPLDVAGGEGLYIDDFRFQPAKSGVSCYVYDKQSFRLITQFDDSHFGTYYQYNNEGKLTRVIKETERGMKTLKETQYNIPRIPL